ncbi:MAG: VWD domain-containing protein, partial [Xenococcus sp. (in: cyanobacteria)]
GEELSADELLRMKVEDDWAIGFLDGEMVSIEQRTIEEELNFSAEKINNWLTPVDFTTPEPFVFFNEKIANWQETDNSGFLKFDAAIESNLKGEAFFTLGNLGETQFSYPVNLDVEMPRNALAGQAFDFLPKAPQAPEDSSRGFAKINQGTGAFELPNAGVKFELDLLQAKFSNVEIDLPNGSYKVDDNFFSFASGGSKAQLNIDLQSFLSGAGNTLLEPLNKLLTNTGVTFEIPKISEFKSFDPGGNSNNLPSIGIRGKSNNVLDFKLDVDNFILSSPLSPTSAAYNAAQTAANLAGVKLEGLGFSVEYPSSLIEETKAKEAINKLDSRKKELGIEEVILFDPANNLTPEEQEILNLQQEAVKTNSDFNSVNDAVKKERFKLKFQGDLLDIKFNGGVGVQQDFVFEPEDVQVSIEVDKGTVEQTQATGSGTPIKITPPEGSGTMTITARYELFGNIKNSIGPIIQGGVNTKLLELSGEISAFGAKVLPFQIGPVLSGQFAAATPSLELFNSSINTSEIAQNEGNKLVIERTYSIPYGPISISDASAEEGETLQFTVTLAEPSEESVNVAYQSDKGSGTVTFAAGETTKIIEIPTPDDETEEPTENFEITINPNSESSVTATGTIFDNDRPDPKPEGGQGSGHGDPHLTTFDGLYYDFQAAGEFIVAKSDSGDLEIQARQRPFIDRPVSVNSAVATKIGDQRIGFYADEDLLIQIDGQPVEIPDNESIPVGEGEIFRDGRVYTVVYPTGDQLEVNTALSFRGVNYLNYNIFLNEDREGAISGILGNNNGNTDDDIILTDGTVLEKPSREQLYGSYADSWRVTQESSLFDYEPGRDTNSFTISGFPETDITVESLDPEDVARARELIGDRLTDPILINATIIDLVLSDFDESFIEAAEQVARTPETSIIIDIEPEVVPDTATTSIDTPITINVLANDISTPGVPLSLETFPQTSAGGGIITRSDNGTPEDTTDDQLTYTPPINYSGTDTFQYTVNDRDETASGIVTVNIPSINLSRFNNGFTVNGANPGSFSGASVSNIGDFNGDQIDDFIIGALGADPNNNTAAGEAYVIFGNNNGLP